MTMRSRRTTWVAGGIGLIACGVAGLLERTSFGPAAQAVLSGTGAALFAFSVSLFALGLSRDASVVRRRPIGVISLMGLSAWTVAAFVWDHTPSAPPLPDPLQATSTYGLLLAPVILTVVGVWEIGRAAVVPPPWCWAPAWAFVMSATTWIISQVAFAKAPGSQIAADITSLFGMLAFLASTLGLGILAVAVAARRRTAAVDVIRPH